MEYGPAFMLVGIVIGVVLSVVFLRQEEPLDDVLEAERTREQLRRITIYWRG